MGDVHFGPVCSWGGEYFIRAIAALLDQPIIAAAPIPRITTCNKVLILLMIRAQSSSMLISVHALLLRYVPILLLMIPLSEQASGKRTTNLG